MKVGKLDMGNEKKVKEEISSTHPVCVNLEEEVNGRSCSQPERLSQIERESLSDDVNASNGIPSQGSEGELLSETTAASFVSLCLPNQAPVAIIANTPINHVPQPTTTTETSRSELKTARKNWSDSRTTARCSLYPGSTMPEAAQAVQVVQDAQDEALEVESLLLNRNEGREGIMEEERVADKHAVDTPIDQNGECSLSVPDDDNNGKEGNAEQLPASLRQTTSESTLAFAPHATSVAVNSICSTSASNYRESETEGNGKHAKATSQNDTKHSSETPSVPMKGKRKRSPSPFDHSHARRTKPRNASVVPSDAFTAPMSGGGRCRRWEWKMTPEKSLLRVDLVEEGKKRSCRGRRESLLSPLVKRPGVRTGRGKREGSKEHLRKRRGKDNNLEQKEVAMEEDLEKKESRIPLEAETGLPVVGRNELESEAKVEAARDGDKALDELLGDEMWMEEIVLVQLDSTAQNDMEGVEGGRRQEEKELEKDGMAAEEAPDRQQKCVASRELKSKVDGEMESGESLRKSDRQQTFELMPAKNIFEVEILEYGTKRACRDRAITYFPATPPRESKLQASASRAKRGRRKKKVQEWEGDEYQSKMDADEPLTTMPPRPKSFDSQSRISDPFALSNGTEATTEELKFSVALAMDEVGFQAIPNPQSTRATDSECNKTHEYTSVTLNAESSDILCNVPASRDTSKLTSKSRSWGIPTNPDEEEAVLSSVHDQEGKLLDTELIARTSAHSNQQSRRVQPLRLSKTAPHYLEQMSDGETENRQHTRVRSQRRKLQSQRHILKTWDKNPSSKRANERMTGRRAADVSEEVPEVNIFTEDPILPEGSSRISKINAAKLTRQQLTWSIPTSKPGPNKRFNSSSIKLSLSRPQKVSTKRLAGQQKGVMKKNHSVGKRASKRGRGRRQQLMRATRIVHCNISRRSNRITRQTEKAKRFETTMKLFEDMADENWGVANPPPEEENVDSLAVISAMLLQFDHGLDCANTSVVDEAQAQLEESLYEASFEIVTRLSKAIELLKPVWKAELSLKIKKEIVLYDERAMRILDDVSHLQPAARELSVHYSEGIRLLKSTWRNQLPLAQTMRRRQFPEGIQRPFRNVKWKKGMQAPGDIPKGANKGVIHPKILEADWVALEKDQLHMISGKPPIWSQTRQELCEALDYYRTYQSGSYYSGGLVHGYLLNGFPAARDQWAANGKVIISHGGGKSMRDPTDPTKRVLFASQSEDASFAVSALTNTMLNGYPIVLWRQL
ncbi:hypothetical protein BT69DRAFT_204585 [Atractiella rhizophila]|nr:hypothetical protein BT69DRAFT_204585 [Atractiella rhizophila]